MTVVAARRLHAGGKWEPYYPDDTEPRIPYTNSEVVMDMECPILINVEFVYLRSGRTDNEAIVFQLSTDPGLYFAIHNMGLILPAKHKAWTVDIYTKSPAVDTNYEYLFGVVESLEAPVLTMKVPHLSQIAGLTREKVDGMVRDNAVKEAELKKRASWCALI